MPNKSSLFCSAVLIVSLIVKILHLWPGITMGSNWYNFRICYFTLNILLKLKKWATSGSKEELSFMPLSILMDAEATDIGCAGELKDYTSSVSTKVNLLCEWHANCLLLWGNHLSGEKDQFGNKGTNIFIWVNQNMPSSPQD